MNTLLPGNTIASNTPLRSHTHIHTLLQGSISLCITKSEVSGSMIVVKKEAFLVLHWDEI